jgi:hypothetical protein
MARLEDSRQTLPHKKKAAGIGTTKGSVKAARLRSIAPRRFPSEPNMTVSALAQPFIDVNQDSEG